MRFEHHGHALSAFPLAEGPVVVPDQLCRDAGLAVLVARPATLAEAVTVVEWAAEHATESSGTTPVRCGAPVHRAAGRRTPNPLAPPNPRSTTTLLPLLATFTIAALSACGTADAGPRAEPTAQPGRYASVNGLDLYHEVHGPETGRPLVLPHGALSGVEPDFGELIPELAKHRRVIAIEQQGHGHTADIDRPFRVEHMAADTTALLDQLGVTDVDILGYSMGGLIALSIGLDQPDLVHKLVLVTPGYDNNSSHPGLMEGMDEIKPEMPHGSSFHDYYLEVAADPADLPTLVAKNTDMQQHHPNHPKSAIEGLAPPVLLVAGDSDLVPPEYLVEFFRLLGGGVMGDLQGLPDSQLAVSPAPPISG